jgi:hypothetical protein
MEMGYGPELKPMQSLGYKQMVQYLSGNGEKEIKERRRRKLSLGAGGRRNLLQDVERLPPLSRGHNKLAQFSVSCISPDRT